MDASQSLIAACRPLIWFTVSYKGHPRHVSGHSEPTPPCALHYLPISSLLTDFPVSSIFRCELEPESHPINILHMHDVLEIGYCHAGAGILVVENRVRTFGAGDVAVVNRNLFHMSRGSCDGPSLWSYFWIDSAALLAGVPEGLALASQDTLSGSEFPNTLARSLHPALCQTVHDIVKEIEANRSDSRLIVRGLAVALLAQLHRLGSDRKAQAGHASAHGVDRISPALQHIANHYSEEIAVDELAEACDLSLTHFRRLFLAATSHSPMAYLAQVRSRMAAAVLREHPDKPITQVATAVGFDAINTFNRQFRRTLGVSPREWRRRWQ